MRPLLPSLHAADFFLDEGLQIVLDHLRLPAPVATRSPVYVLLECAAAGDPTDELAAALAQAGIDDALVATDSAERTRLWRFRRGPRGGDLGRRDPAQAGRRSPLPRRLADRARAPGGAARGRRPARA